MALSLSPTLQEWISQNITTGLPSSPSTSVLTYTVGWSHRRCWASLSSPTGRLVRRRLVSSPIRLVGHTTVVGRLRLHRSACLHRRRLVFPPARLAYYAAVDGHLRLHCRLASVATDWCICLHGWLVTPPLLRIYVLTAGSPRLSPIGVLAYTVGWSHHRCWVYTSSPTGHLV
uniref:HGWP repeat containing protein-like n=1 Tax=Oryza nivara TaxID=4536 RepID=A0A679BEB3_ORYNI|nr:HGWP repeat containing protein-like [Oryza sativa f. spontanea]